MATSTVPFCASTSDPHHDRLTCSRCGPDAELAAAISRQSRCCTRCELPIIFANFLGDPNVKQAYDAHLVTRGYRFSFYLNAIGELCSIVVSTGRGVTRHHCR